MANRSIKRLVESLPDVLVKVDKFILSVDYVILDWEVDVDMPIILGRPFLDIESALVDVKRLDLRFQAKKRRLCLIFTR